MGFFNKRPTTQQSDPAKDFDPSSDHYKCCCGQLHITTGATIVGIFYILAVTTHLITASINYSRVGGLYSALFGKSVANFVFCIVAVLFLFYALRTHKRVFIIPMLVYQVVFGVIMVVLISLLIKALARSGKNLWELSHLVGDPSNPQSSTVSTVDQESRLVVTVVLGIILLLVCIFALLVDIRYFFVIFICFKYFRDKEIYDKVRNESYKELSQVKTTAIVMLDDKNPYERKPPAYNEVSV